MLAAPVALEERRELTGLLLTLAGLRLPTGELLAAARRNPMIDELLRESGMAEEFIREGMERGRQEGLERGRDETLRQSVRLALEGRFGTLEPELVAAIERADQAPLEQMLLHVATETPAQLRARLGL